MPTDSFVWFLLFFFGKGFLLFIAVQIDVLLDFAFMTQLLSSFVDFCRCIDLFSFFFFELYNLFYVQNDYRTCVIPILDFVNMDSR